MNPTQCKQICSLYEKARQCNVKCSKNFGHIDECLCNNKKENHLCKQKCHLCEYYCSKPFNHENDHLCGGKHPCNGMCEQSGYCRILIEMKKKKKKMDLIYLMNLFNFKNQ